MLQRYPRHPMHNRVNNAQEKSAFAGVPWNKNCHVRSCRIWVGEKAYGDKKSLRLTIGSNILKF